LISVKSSKKTSEQHRAGLAERVLLELNSYLTGLENEWNWDILFRLLHSARALSTLPATLDMAKHRELFENLLRQTERAIKIA